MSPQAAPVRCGPGVAAFGRRDRSWSGAGGAAGRAGAVAPAAPAPGPAGQSGAGAPCVLCGGGQRGQRERGPFDSSRRRFGFVLGADAINPSVRVPGGARLCWFPAPRVVMVGCELAVPCVSTDGAAGVGSSAFLIYPLCSVLICDPRAALWL